MPRFKLPKTKRKTKNKKEDKSRIISCAVEEHEVTSTGKQEVGDKGSPKQKCTNEPVRRREKSAKQVHFAVLPEKYEPLQEEQTADKTVEESCEKQHKYKQFRKNFGKALRYSWKCLVVGLQSFSTAYSGPLSAATTLVSEVQRPMART
ncbi:required for drug-induced death protein 1 [Trichomycterus rosablanca]|uniref:required for drug-induced death protein 1 n=1 Tax=Trichomycterus rosablanca TaxID=2290929 RepID=UPI002F360551